MEHVKETLKQVEQNIILDTKDPVAREGFTQVPNFVLKANNISAGAKLAYAMLLSYAWNNNFCFPGQEKLAQDMGAGVRSVKRYMRELVRKGYVSVKRRGLGKTNVYVVHFRAQKKKR